MVKTDKRKNVLLAAIAVLLLIFLHFSKIIAPIESILIGFFRPALSKMYYAGSIIRTSYDNQTSKRDLAKDVNELEERLSALIVENSKLKEFEEENKTFRGYLNFLSKSGTRYLMADIISAGELEISGARQTIIVNKGSKDGLRSGLAVISSEGIIIGKVVEVKDHISKAFLTTNERCKLAATIQNQDKTAGIAEGDLGLTIKMNFIPQTKEIKAGETVITSGLEENIPRGLVIGAVSRVDKENNELWQSATIEPLVDPNNLSAVSILLPD